MVRHWFNISDCRLGFPAACALRPPATPATPDRGRGLERLRKIPALFPLHGRPKTAEALNALKTCARLPVQLKLGLHVHGAGYGEDKRILPHIYVATLAYLFLSR